jgi:hypothetical protein
VRRSQRPDSGRVGSSSSRGDIADSNLGATFDAIIAPFRVIQNLEADEQLGGLFHSIRGHLALEGRCILNVLMPFKPRNELLRT